MQRVLVLANSKKMHGRCVAGRELDTGRWVRPVSRTVDGELTDLQASVLLPDGGRRLARLGDIVDVELGAARPTLWHPEDVVMAGPMQLVDTMPIADLAAAEAKRLPLGARLLGNDGDRVAVTEIAGRTSHSSLQLVDASPLTCYWKSWQGGPAKLRGQFSVRGKPLDLSVTDLAFLELHKATGGRFQVPDALLTVSLANPFVPESSTEQYCFKVIAAVMPH